MNRVLLTALGVGGATLIGALLGFLFQKPSKAFHNLILSFAAGIMLAASFLGLILPSLESDHRFAVPIAIFGIFLGALCLNGLDKLVPHLHRLTGTDTETHPQASDGLHKILLFVLAIAIHNLPEGLAAGVGFGSGNDADALFIAGGIALQNIPEGMVIIAPLLSVGVSKGRTLLLAAATGLVEVIGTFLGYFAINAVAGLLPFSLAFAGGTMLYVISDEMIPETHRSGKERGSTYALLAGFCLMLILDSLLA